MTLDSMSTANLIMAAAGLSAIVVFIMNIETIMKFFALILLGFGAIMGIAIGMIYLLEVAPMTTSAGAGIGAIVAMFFAAITKNLMKG